MGEVDTSVTPELHEPVLARLPAQTGPAVGFGLVVAALAAVLWLAMPDSPDPAHLIPKSAADLGEGMVTVVDRANRPAVAAAVTALRLPEAQRLQIEKDVLEGRRRIAWIIFIDSMDPDGDTVSVEAGGIVQQVLLSKAWTPVAIPLDGPGVIGVTAVRDGGGGGITVALATRGGPVVLRVLLPGERVEVAAS